MDEDNVYQDMTIAEIAETLITDRVQEDVDAINDKGTYNSSDLNRVGSVVEYLSYRLQAIEDDLRAFATANDIEWQDEFELGFEPEEAIVTAKVDWVMYDLQTKRQMRKYLNNIIRMCTLLEVDYTELPETMVHLTYEDANIIERLVKECLFSLDALEKNKKRLMLGGYVPDWYLIYMPINSVCYVSPDNRTYCVQRESED